MPAKSLNGHLQSNGKSPSGPPLTTIQKWFQTFIVSPGEELDAVHSAQEVSGLRDTRPEDLVLPSKTLTPLQRMMIYRDQYLLRMEEALDIDYPVLSRYLGPEAFFDLISRYVQAHPSQSYTLNHLGQHLPEFVLTCPGLKRRTLLHDLCRVEWGLSAIIDEDLTSPLSPQEVGAIEPEAWASAVLTPIPSLRLLELKYPVQEWIKAYHDAPSPSEGAAAAGGYESSMPEIKARPTWLMLWRREDGSWRMPLSRPGFELLTRLASGMPVGSAMDEVLARRRIKPVALFEAFTNFLGEGLFCQVAVLASK